MSAIFERDRLCVVHGDHSPQEEHHRIHGNRADNRASNKLGVCRAAHHWIEHHPRDARAKGWTVSRHGQDTTEVPVWIEAGWFGTGWYSLNDELGFTDWPGRAETP